MKKAILLAILLCSSSLFLPLNFAEAAMRIPDDKDMRGTVLDKNQQYVLIGYENGTQKMILNISPEFHTRFGRVVWIVPIPADSAKIKINLLNGFPFLSGDFVKKVISNSTWTVLEFIGKSDPFALPYYFLKALFTSNFVKVVQAASSDNQLAEGVNVFQSITQDGLRAEVFSIKDEDALDSYLIAKNLHLSYEYRKLLNDYVGKNYSFVSTWISEPEQFIKKQTELQQDIGSGCCDYMPGLNVYIEFPTKEIFFPLKSIAIHRDLIIPIIIYVLDYVRPDLTNEMQASIETNYFFDKSAQKSVLFEDLFANFNNNLINYYGNNSPQTDETILSKDLNYTKIKIPIPYKLFESDLIIKPSSPIPIIEMMKEFDRKPVTIYSLIFYVICSCLASLLSAMICFRKKQISKIKFLFFGLYNILTVVVFTIVAYIKKIDSNFVVAEAAENNSFSFTKTLKTWSLLVVIFLPLYLLFHYWFLRYCGFGYLLIYSLIFHCLFIVLLMSISWAYSKNKKIFGFVILFIIIFIILTNIFQTLFLVVSKRIATGIQNKIDQIQIFNQNKPSVPLAELQPGGLPLDIKQLAGYQLIAEHQLGVLSYTSNQGVKPKQWRVYAYNAISQEKKEVAQLSVHHAFHSFDYFKNKIYYISPIGELSFFDIINGQQGIISIPGISPVSSESNKATLTDFLIMEDKVYYLSGDCDDVEGGGKCYFGEYDTLTRSNQIISDLSSQIKAREIILAGYDNSKNVFIINSIEYGGVETQLVVYEFDVSTKKINVINSKTLQYCEDLDPSCLARQKESQLAYDEIYNYGRQKICNGEVVYNHSDKSTTDSPAFYFGCIGN